MQRIGYFSIRGYWRAPLAVFVVIVVGGVAVPGGREFGIGLLGFGAACSAIIACILSFTATLNQNVVEMMHEVDSSLQLVDYSFSVLGDSRLKMNSARGEWQIDIPTKSSAPWVRFRGPNELHRVIAPAPGHDGECRLGICWGVVAMLVMLMQAAAVGPTPVIAIPRMLAMKPTFAFRGKLMLHAWT